MEKESSIMPAGSMFLPGTSKTCLQQIQRKETDPKAARRLLVFLRRKEGMSIRQICAVMNMPYTTVRNWLVRAVQLGLSGRYDEARPGAQCKLNDRQLAQLRQELISGPRSCGFESGVWTAPLAMVHVRRRYGVQYAEGGMYDLLRRIGFSSRKPRPRHPKSASKSQIKAFKKKPDA